MQLLPDFRTFVLKAQKPLLLWQQQHPKNGHKFVMVCAGRSFACRELSLSLSLSSASSYYSYSLFDVWGVGGSLAFSASCGVLILSFMQINSCHLQMDVIVVFLRDLYHDSIRAFAIYKCFYFFGVCIDILLDISSWHISLFRFGALKGDFRGE